MRIAAITTFPPSQNPLSSFGYHAVRSFLQAKDVEQLVVLADQSEGPVVEDDDRRLTVLRCWRYNDIRSALGISNALKMVDPDVVWMNLQYTSFGYKPVPAFLGLLVPALLRRQGYPVAVLLHNYLHGVDATRIGMRLPVRSALKVADYLAMKSIMGADCILTMVEEYQRQLAGSFPGSKIRLVQQDLYPIPPFCPVRTGQNTIATVGYFGTYKKLEVLIEAFCRVRQEFHNARLLIAGRDTPYTPGYLADLANRYRNQLDGVSFCGYLAEEVLSDVLIGSNVVCVTNATVPGDSGIVRLAATSGRGVVAPDIAELQVLIRDGWLGIEFYRPNHAESLACALAGVLRSGEKQSEMAEQNYSRAVRDRNSFFLGHYQIFRELSGSYD